MDRKVCIITGANSGIGKEAAIQLANRGCHVILACRNKERGTQALQEILGKAKDSSVELRLVDMSSQTSIGVFAKEILATYPRVDVLIHNAAIFDITQKTARYTLEGVETIWATNHIGPVLLTQLLLPALRNSEAGRILTISSKGLLAKPALKVNLDDPEFKNRRFSVAEAYYQSKRAQEMFTLWQSGRLAGLQVTINCIRVTAVSIDEERLGSLSPWLKRLYALKSKHSLAPHEMALTYADLAVSEDMRGVSGKIFDENQQHVHVNAYTKDPKAIDTVMDLTLKYLRVQKG